MRPPSPSRALLRALARTAPLLPLAGCAGGVLDPRGPIGAADRMILINAIEIMLVIVVPTILAALAFAWWFRASNKRARYQPHFAYSGRIELIVWSIPILVILFLGGVIWIGAHDLDPAVPIDPARKPLEIEVVSLDWKWLFVYPEEGIASVNDLVVPAGVPLHFSLTSATVMNVFFVPQLGSMVYTMNGMVTQLHLEADRPGEYYGESAQYSGAGFSDMHFTLRAIAADDFASWVAAARQGGPVLDRAGYAVLAEESRGVRPFTYREVDPALFRDVAAQRLPPGPGPAEKRGEPAARARTED